MKRVIANKGAAGVDKLPVKSLKFRMETDAKNWVTQLREEKYYPQAILGVEIPKGGGKTRLLGIPTVTDRLLQQAVQQVLTPRWERDFHDNSYGFRPNKSARQAVGKALEYIHQGHCFIVDIDLKNFFDEVNHDLLLNLVHQKVKCPSTMTLIRRWLRAPILLQGRLVKRRKGIPQGGPLSPLLSNILLHELDKELERRGLKFIRYADDFSIYLRTNAEAHHVKRTITKFLETKLQLKVNEEKSGIRKPVQFQMLGFGFVARYEKGVRGKYQLVANKKSWDKLKFSLKAITRKTKPMSFDERIAKINEVQRGWLNYFQGTNIQGKLRDLDGWLRNRLRYCIWHHWKKTERKRKNLIRLGVHPEDAYAWSRTRMGGWAVAKSPILRTTLTLAKFKRRGYQPLLELYEKPIYM